jgi:hypothetical protein
VPQIKRRAENQQLFREVNERIAELWTILDEHEAPLAVVCECRRVGCVARGAVPLDVYGRTRENADLYVVVCGREDPTHEETVEDHGEFVVVRSHAFEPGELAPA